MWLSMHRPDADFARGSLGARTRDDFRADVGLLARLYGERCGARTPFLVCGDRYAFAVSLCAAAVAGIQVVLPPNSQPETLRSIGETQGTLAVHDGALSLVPDALDLRELLRGATPESSLVPLPELRDEQPFVTLYTSGTTRGPRGVSKTVGQLFREARLQAELLNVTERDAVLSTVHSQHIYGLIFSVLVPVVSGAVLCRDTPLHAEDVSANITKLAATVLVSVPAHLRSLARAPHDLGTLRLALSSGAPLPPALAAELVPAVGRVVEVFGSTETGGMAYREPALGAAWSSLPGVELAVGADELVVVRSPFVSGGVAEAYLSADRAVHDAAGLRFLGRADRVVKVGSTRVDLDDLVEHIKAVPGVRDAAVLPLPSHRARGVDLWAAVAADASVDVTTLRQSLLRDFDPVVLPRVWRLAAALPRDAAGKLKRDDFVRWFDAEKPLRQLVVLDAAFEAPGHYRETCFIPSHFRYCEGHFEERAVVPGVFLLSELFARGARHAFEGLGELRGVRRAKFQRPIFPRDMLTVDLQSDGLEVNAEVRVSGQRACLASLYFSPPQAT